MKFVKITVLNESSDQTLGDETNAVLFNLDHIVSIKPIMISKDNQIIDGYWIRTSNGKKYRATKIPAELASFFEGECSTAKIMESIDANNQDFLSSDSLVQ
jgi:hypothetical protein